jgi:DNA-binding transcriptional MerR regulator
MLYDPCMSTETRRGYLRIGELARRTGTSPELLRAWEQRYGLLRPERSPGGFRLYSDGDEARVRRMRAWIGTGLSAAEAARRALEVEEEAGEESAFVAEGLADELEAAMDRFDGEAGHRALDRLLARFSVETVLEDALMPYLRRLGDRWAVGEISVAQEHFASSLIRGRLFGLAREWGAGGGPAVVLACPPGEEHDLGLIVFGIVLARRGWRVTYLGADTPFATLEQAAASLRPALVVLSVSDPGRIDPHEEEIARLAAVVPLGLAGELNAERAEGLGARLLAGGPVEAARALADRHPG